MAGTPTKKFKLNSYWSLCYCLLTLGVHIYTTYLSVLRYNDAQNKAWPKGERKPPEIAFLLSMIITSCVLLPFFVVSAFFMIGNIANDGIKMGRDHALNSQFRDACKNTDRGLLQRLWQHFCPTAQTIHLVSAFCLILPETFLTAVEILNGYRTTDAAWTSDIDFLFARDRAHLSDIRSSFNESMLFNETYYVPSSRSHSSSFYQRYSLTIGFVNFCAALLAITVRYAAVFWFTNKVLTFVFSFQLLAMSLTSIFGFCGFSLLYKVCYNNPLYHNIDISLSCVTMVTLYLFGGFVVLISTITVFEYGSVYFHQKFKIVDRKHNPETYVKQTVIVQSGCRGYIPHTCATVTLVLMAACKGPILYDLVTVYRLSNDTLVLTCVIFEVTYMLFWITFWCGLTIKQQWKFKILDYVPLKKPVFMIGKESVVKNPTFDSKRLELEMMNVPRSRSPLPMYDGILIETREPSMSDDDNTETSDNPNETNSIDGSAKKKLPRKNGARVTFEDTRRRSLGVEDRTRARSRTPVIVEPNHVNVKVDVHTGEPSRIPDEREQNNAASKVHLRQNATSSIVPRDYRNSLKDRSDFCTNINNLSTCSDEATCSPTSEPLPTLMSSFRDKVRESSRAAISYKEQRNMLENPNSFSTDTTKPNNDSLQRKAAKLEPKCEDVYLKVNLDNLDLKNHICDSPLRPGVTDGPIRPNSSSGYSEDSKCSTFKTPDLSPLSNSPLNAELTSDAGVSNNKLANGKIEYNGDKEYLFPRPVHLLVKKPEIGRRDSANYSLTSSQDTSSNDSDHGHGGLCSQKQNGIVKNKPPETATTPSSPSKVNSSVN